MTISDQTSKLSSLCLICKKPVSQTYWYAQCTYCESNFHPHHLKIWLETHYTCPKCEYPFDPDLISYYNVQYQETSYHSIRKRKNKLLPAATRLNELFADDSVNSAAMVNSSLDGRYDPAVSCQCIPFRINLLPDLKSNPPSRLEKIIMMIPFLFLYGFISLLISVIFDGTSGSATLHNQTMEVAFVALLLLHLIIAIIKSLTTYFTLKHRCPMHHIISINI